MPFLKRRAAGFAPVPLSIVALIAFAPVSHAAAPTSYGGQQAKTTVPTTNVDLEYSPGPSAGTGGGRRVR